MKRRRKIAALCCAVLLSTTTHAGEPLEWTAKNGKTIEAEYVSHDAEFVTLLIPTRVKIDALSATSVKQMAEAAKAKRAATETVEVETVEPVVEPVATNDDEQHDRTRIQKLVFMLSMAARSDKTWTPEAVQSESKKLYAELKSRERPYGHWARIIAEQCQLAAEAIDKGDWRDACWQSLNIADDLALILEETGTNE